MTLNELRQHIKEISDPEQWLEMLALAIEKGAEHPEQVANTLYAENEDDKETFCMSGENAHKPGPCPGDFEGGDDDESWLNEWDQAEFEENIADVAKQTEREGREAKETKPMAGEATGDYTPQEKAPPDDNFELDPNAEQEEMDMGADMSPEELAAFEKEFDEVMADLAREQTANQAPTANLRKQEYMAGGGMAGGFAAPGPTSGYVPQEIRKKKHD